MKRHAFFQCGLIFIFILILLGGCVSKGAVSLTTPITANLSTYKTMLLNISSQFPGSYEEIVQQNMIIADALKKRLFDRVIAGSLFPDAQADLRLDAKITALKKVSPGERFWGGAMAGRAGVDVEVELFDLRKNKSIGAFFAQGRSSGGTIFAGTTSQAVRRAAEKIVKFIQKSM